MATIGAFAPVTWTDGTGEDSVLFIIGDTPQEIEDHDRIIYERLGDTEDIEDILVLEVTSKQWWDIKHGTNISLGYYINNTQQIEPINKETNQ